MGLLAARRVGIPVIGVSRGWTAECARVRLYELIDRCALRWMDKVVCVSEAQAQKVRLAGVREDKICVIHNAICCDRFECRDPIYREQLRQMFPKPPAMVVCAAGRLSPEKGFGVLADAAAIVLRLGGRVQGSGFKVQGAEPDVGFVLFGDGPLREELERQIADHGLNGRFILAGFRADLDRFLPHLDLVVLPSFTEGLPNVALEALAAGVPVVATAVGGTPEVIEDGRTGYLVPPGDATALADRIGEALFDPAGRSRLAHQGRDFVAAHFSFDAQAAKYCELFSHLTAKGRSVTITAARAMEPATGGTRYVPAAEIEAAS